jgi:hypothetical protein
MSEKKCARIFGVVLFLIGFLGFLPGFTTDDLFLGIFKVNSVTNTLHLLTGIIAYVFSHGSQRASQLFFQICGIFYGIVAVLGFGYEEFDILGYIANNMADSWLHLFLSLLSLYLGFLYKNVRKTA